MADSAPVGGVPVGEPSDSIGVFSGTPEGKGGVVDGDLETREKTTAIPHVGRKGKFSDTAALLLILSLMARLKDASVPPGQETKKAWSFLSRTTKEYEEERLKVWKEEMDNILVFAGLLSAAITGFVVDSAKKLEEDPAKRSANLLQQISLQLSSSAGNLDSTGSTPDAFTPRAIDVKINSLWFLSLSLSLTSAFLALAVQQWLRTLPRPQNLPTAQSVFLRQNHWVSIFSWQLPNIINLIPVLLQVSLVLFVLGLYFSLRGLDHPITTAFSIMTGIPLFLYAGLLILPLWWPRCPFRSPLIPTTLFIWQVCKPTLHGIFIIVRICLIYTIVAALSIAFLCVVPIYLAVFTILFTARAVIPCLGSGSKLRSFLLYPFQSWFRGQESDMLGSNPHNTTPPGNNTQPMPDANSGTLADTIAKVGPQWRWYTSNVEKITGPTLGAGRDWELPWQSFIRTLAESNDFWTRRAMDHVFRVGSGDKSSSTNAPQTTSPAPSETTPRDETHGLEYRALLRAPQSTSTEKLGKLMPLFEKLNRKERASCILHWLIGRSHIYEELPLTTMNWAFYIDLRLVDGFRDFLPKALPEKPEIEKSDISTSDKINPFALILVLLTRISTSDQSISQRESVSKLRCQVQKSLLLACAKQEDSNAIAKNRYFILCLYLCSRDVGPSAYDAKDIEQIVRIAMTCMMPRTISADDVFAPVTYFEDGLGMREAILAAVATALSGYDSSPPGFWNDNTHTSQLNKLLNNFRRSLEAWTRDFTLKKVLGYYLRKQHSHFFTPLSAMRSIAKSLESLHSKERYISAVSKNSHAEVEALAAKVGKTKTTTHCFEWKEFYEKADFLRRLLPSSSQEATSPDMRPGPMPHGLSQSSVAKDDTKNATTALPTLESV